MSRKIPFEQAKVLCDRAIEIKRDFGLTWEGVAERSQLTKDRMRGLLKRIYPHKKYCPLKKKLCSCVIMGVRNAFACGYEDDTRCHTPFKYLKECPCEPRTR